MFECVQIRNGSPLIGYSHRYTASCLVCEDRIMERNMQQYGNVPRPLQSLPRLYRVALDCAYNIQRRKFEFFFTACKRIKNVHTSAKFLIFEQGRGIELLERISVSLIRFHYWNYSNLESLEFVTWIELLTRLGGRLKVLTKLRYPSDTFQV